MPKDMTQEEEDKIAEIYPWINEKLDQQHTMKELVNAARMAAIYITEETNLVRLGMVLGAVHFLWNVVEQAEKERHFADIREATGSGKQ